MGRRTLHKPQFKERRGNGVQAQVFALRRALSIKAQLVKNQQCQIDLLGRELANACMRIAALERGNAREDETWERISNAVARSRVALDPVAADALRTGAGAFSFVAERMDLAPPSDGVFDQDLHGDPAARSNPAGAHAGLSLLGFRVTMRARPRGPVSPAMFAQLTRLTSRSAGRIRTLLARLLPPLPP